MHICLKICFVMAIMAFAFTIYKIEHDHALGLQLHSNAILTFNVVPSTPIPTSETATFKKCGCNLNKKRSSDFSSLKNDLEQTDPNFNMSSSSFLEKTHPNLPLDIFTSAGSCCSSLPRIYKIRWSSRIWQILVSKKGIRYSLYSAFYENRTSSVPRPAVKILLLKDSTKEENLYCNIWFDKTKEPTSCKALRQEHIDYQTPSDNRLMPFLVICPLAPEDAHMKPVAVSLTDSSCSASNNLLKVIGEGERNMTSSIKSKSKENQIEWNVGVCGPALYYYHNDFSKRLIDWVETVKAIGLSKIFLYETEVHPNIKKVLEYYSSKKENFIKLTPFTYPEPYIDDPSLRSYWTNKNRHQMFALEIVYFTDCVMRNKDEFRFLVHIDPDEAPIINGGKSISELMTELLKKNEKKIQPAYAMKWTEFPENLPPGTNAQNISENLYILRHNLKHKVANNFKSIFDTDYADGVFSHGLISCTFGRCQGRKFVIPPDLAYAAHYRRICDEACQNGSELTPISDLFVYEKIILENVNNVLKILKLS